MQTSNFGFYFYVLGLYFYLFYHLSIKIVSFFIVDTGSKKCSFLHSEISEEGECRLRALTIFPWCDIQCEAYVGKIWSVQIEERICYNILYAHQKCSIFLSFNNRFSMQLDTAIIQLISVMNMCICM